MTEHYRNPVPTVDIIIEIESGTGAPGGRYIVLIKRKNPPYGWAIPGGFVDYGETLEAAAVREALEETSPGGSPGQAVPHLFRSGAGPAEAHHYDCVHRPDPARPPPPMTRRRPASSASTTSLPMAFDHADILRDYREKKY